jgi:hypothetical protein
MARTAEEELEYLQTKLLLLGATTFITEQLNAHQNRWAVTRLDKPTFFRFKKPNNIFYPTQEEAIRAGIELFMQGAEQWDDRAP